MKLILNFIALRQNYKFYQINNLNEIETISEFEKWT
jgi:hypothetical protein